MNQKSQKYDVKQRYATSWNSNQLLPCKNGCNLTINTNDLKRHTGLWPIDVVGLIFF